MLSCCHSFYTQCIQSLITDGSGTNSIICSYCHMTTQVPKGGVTHLPCNLRLINKQGDILNKINSNPPPPCDSCNEAASVFYCTECTDLLCKQCWDAYKKLRSTRTHSSFTLEKAHAMSQDKLTKLIPSFTHTRWLAAKVLLPTMYYPSVHSMYNYQPQGPFCYRSK